MTHTHMGSRPISKKLNEKGSGVQAKTRDTIPNLQTITELLYCYTYTTIPTVR